MVVPADQTGDGPLAQRRGAVRQRGCVGGGPVIQDRHHRGRNRGGTVDRRRVADVGRHAVVAATAAIHPGVPVGGRRHGVLRLPHLHRRRVLQKHEIRLQLVLRNLPDVRHRLQPQHPLQLVLVQRRPDRLPVFQHRYRVAVRRLQVLQNRIQVLGGIPQPNMDIQLRLVGANLVQQHLPARRRLQLECRRVRNGGLHERLAHQRGHRLVGSPHYQSAIRAGLHHRGSQLPNPGLDPVIPRAGQRRLGDLNDPRAVAQSQPLALRRRMRRQGAKV